MVIVAHLLLCLILTAQPLLGHVIQQPGASAFESVARSKGTAVLTKRSSSGPPNPPTGFSPEPSKPSSRSSILRLPTLGRKDKNRAPPTESIDYASTSGLHPVPEEAPATGRPSNSKPKKKFGVDFWKGKQPANSRESRPPTEGNIQHQSSPGITRQGTDISVQSSELQNDGGNVLEMGGSTPPRRHELSGHGRVGIPRRNTLMAMPTLGTEHQRNSPQEMHDRTPPRRYELQSPDQSESERRDRVAAAPSISLSHRVNPTPNLRSITPYRQPGQYPPTMPRRNTDVSELSVESFRSEDSLQEMHPTTSPHRYTLTDQYRPEYETTRRGSGRSEQLFGPRRYSSPSREFRDTVSPRHHRMATPPQPQRSYRNRAMSDPFGNSRYNENQLRGTQINDILYQQQSELPLTNMATPAHFESSVGHGHQPQASSNPLRQFLPRSPYHNGPLSESFRSPGYFDSPPQGPRMNDFPYQIQPGIPPLRRFPSERVENFGYSGNPYLPESGIPYELRSQERYRRRATSDPLGSSRYFESPPQGLGINDLPYESRIEDQYHRRAIPERFERPRNFDHPSQAMTNRPYHPQSRDQYRPIVTPEPFGGSRNYESPPQRIGLFDIPSQLRDKGPQLDMTTPEQFGGCLDCSTRHQVMSARQNWPLQGRVPQNIGILGPSDGTGNRNHPSRVASPPPLIRRPEVRPNRRTGSDPSFALIDDTEPSKESGSYPPLGQSKRSQARRKELHSQGKRPEVQRDQPPSKQDQFQIRPAETRDIETSWLSDASSSSDGETAQQKKPQD